MKNKIKFIALHVTAAIRRPRNFRWHVAGILREINPPARPIETLLGL